MRRVCVRKGREPQDAGLFVPQISKKTDGYGAFSYRVPLLCERVRLGFSLVSDVTYLSLGQIILVWA